MDNLIKFKSPSGKKIFQGVRVDQGNGTSIMLNITDSDNPKNKRFFPPLFLNSLLINNTQIIL